MTKKLSAAAAALALVLALAGCGDDGAPTNETRTTTNGEEFNDADIAFATDMIQHHAQALSMVDLTLGRELDPEVRQLAEDVRAAQAPEIEQMAAWLTGWDEPVPETVRDHANAHGDGAMEMVSGLPGMMSKEEMSALENAPDAQFKTMWLDAMIEHHQGAIAMAQSEQSEGSFKPAVELAETIESSQQAEIDLMEDLLGS